MTATASGERVLFLCTGNSARSILAEAVARRAGLAAQSAGSSPTGTVHPGALTLLRAQGFDTAGLRSKSWDEFAGCDFELVVTVCDSAARAAAEEAWPVGSGARDTRHWSLPDPAAADDAPGAFRATYGELVERIGALTGED